MSRSVIKDDVVPELPDSSSDEFAHMVALYAWQEGLTANSIVRKLGWDATPANIMKVKRGLKRAQHKFLNLKTLPETSIQDELDERVNAGRPHKIRFYVVNDLYQPRSVAVFAKAADVVWEIIGDVVQDEPSADTNGQQPNTRNVIICNAGGRSVCETVKAMQRNPPLLAESSRQRLEFVASNLAYLHDKFHQSANFLSVTMAEILHTRHMAIPMALDEKVLDLDGREVEFLEGHKQRVKNAALFIAGAGASETGDYPGLMTRYLRNKGFEIPPEAAGDLAFNLLDSEGEGVRLSSKAEAFMKQLNPNMTLEVLHRIVTNNRVLLILESDDPYHKHLIGAAALKGRYATDVVLGARLAKAILEVY